MLRVFDLGDDSTDGEFESGESPHTSFLFLLQMAEFP